jgi:hypothetical protein
MKGGAYHEKIFMVKIYHLLSGNSNTGLPIPEYIWYGPSGEHSERG